MSQHLNSSAAKPVLIFPAGMPRSLEYLARCQRDGQPVIGSSSLSYDVSRERYPEWAYLPYINAPEFKDALRTLIAERGIGGIYTPNPVAWSFLHDALKEIGPDVGLVNPWPMLEELSGYRAAEARAQQVLEGTLPLASSHAPRPALSERKLAALFRHANVIPGMCDDEKTSALCEIARHAPAGDVIEIGSAFGKSAFVLSSLARAYGIGKTLCVDPWQSAYVVQNDDGGLVDSCIDKYDYDEALRVFELNLLPYAADDVNYLRLPSTEAAAHYHARQVVETSTFGRTEYTGSIALLHIDGNHSYEAARAAWAGNMAPAGWIIIDDYIWPYGDGPQRVGDEFLEQNGQRISAAFVMGTALFIQIGYAA
jgi:hypothetical protein